jgi:hypothetical protein
VLSEGLLIPLWQAFICRDPFVICTWSFSSTKKLLHVLPAGFQLVPFVIFVCSADRDLNYYGDNSVT